MKITLVPSDDWTWHQRW